MKKVLGILFIMIFMFAMTGCGSEKEPVINKNVEQIKSRLFIISDHIFTKPGNPNFALNEFLGIIYPILYMFSKSI